MGAGHTHSSASGPHRVRLIVAFGITASVFVAQAIGALITGSLALLVDTAHMLTDTAGLFLALVASAIMHRPASDKFTWGLRRTEVISALLQAGLLFGVGIFALIEGIQRLFDPAEIASDSLLVFGLIGLVANVVAIAVLAGGRGSNLNMKAAFLEVMNDALGSVAVIVSAILITYLDWYRADAIAGILIAALIVPRTVVLLRESFGILLENTPKGVDVSNIRKHFIDLPHVVAVHDLHVTRISSDLPVITAHVIVEESCFTDGHAAEILPQLQDCVAEHFELSIEHSTFQIEPRSVAEREHVDHG